MKHWLPCPLNGSGPLGQAHDRHGSRDAEADVAESVGVGGVTTAAARRRVDVRLAPRASKLLAAEQVDDDVGRRVEAHLKRRYKQRYKQRLYDVC